MRKLLSVIAGAGLLVTMSACAAQPPAGFSACDSGSSAALVKVDGAIGSTVDVTFPTPLVPPSNENAVLISGDGERVTSSDAVSITVSVLDATSGAPIVQPTVLTSFVDGQFPFTSALSCANEGGRVSIVGTIEGLFADRLSGENILPTDNVVVVADINEAFPGRATGADQAPQAGFPAVVLTPNGQPGFTVPATAPPGELKIAALKQGSGATVKAGDDLFVNITGLVWGGSSTFISSWDIGGPSRVTASDITEAERGLPSGLVDAIVGQKVGSQLIVVAPPSSGYPAGAAPEGVTETSTVIFLVDILKIG